MEYARDISSEDAFHHLNFHEEINDGCAAFVGGKRVELRHALYPTAVGDLLSWLLHRRASLGQTGREYGPPLLAEFIPYKVGSVRIELRAGFLRLLSLRCILSISLRVTGKSYIILERDGMFMRLCPCDHYRKPIVSRVRERLRGGRGRVISDYEGFGDVVR